MPYIKEKDRAKILNKIKSLSMVIENEGELNYAFSKLIDLLVQKSGEKYHVYNKIMGVLECVKLELYRRLIAKYEDKKISENGDIYRAGTKATDMRDI
jgi:hypothetical protein